MPIPVGYAQATIGFTGTGMPSGGAVTLGIDVSGTGASPTSIATVIGTEYGSSIHDYSQQAIVLSSVLVKFGPDDIGPSGVVAFALAGGAGSAECQPNVTWLIHKVTAAGGRAGRGRMYVPGVGENQIDSAGTINGAHAAGMQGQATAFLNALIAADIPPVVLHQPGAPISTPTPITDLTVDARIATQRRRLRR